VGRAAKPVVGKIDKVTLDRLNKIPFHFQLISVSQTDVNSELYQRSLSNRYMQYAEDWCDLIAQPLVVVIDPEHVGKYWILDGQHTAKAAQTKFGDNAQIWAKVIDPLNEEDQAMLFVQLNQERKGLSAQQLHKARIGAKNDSALTIKEIADSLRLVLGKENQTPATMNWTPISSVNGIYKMADDYGTNVLERVLKIICGAWTVQSKNFNHQFMMGLGRVIYMNSTIDDQRMSDALSKFDNQTSFAGRAEKLEREAGSDAKINALQYARALVAIYNEADARAHIAV
jgi:hypothetical protein